MRLKTGKRRKSLFVAISEIKTIIFQQKKKKHANDVTRT